MKRFTTDSGSSRSGRVAVLHSVSDGGATMELTVHVWIGDDGIADVSWGVVVNGVEEIRCSDLPTTLMWWNSRVGDESLRLYESAND